MSNTQRRLIVTMSLCAAVTVPRLSFGALIDRGDGLIYDSDKNNTLLADANYAGTSMNLVAADRRNNKCSR